MAIINSKHVILSVSIYTVASDEGVLVGFINPSILPSSCPHCVALYNFVCYDIILALGLLPFQPIASITC